MHLPAGCPPRSTESLFWNSDYSACTAISHPDFVRHIETAASARWLHKGHATHKMAHSLELAPKGFTHVYANRPGPYIDEFLITCWQWKPVQLDGHFDWLSFDTSGSEGIMKNLMLMHDHVQLFRYPEVSKCHQSSGHPIALVYMVSRLWEKSLFFVMGSSREAGSLAGPHTLALNTWSAFRNKGSPVTLPGRKFLHIQPTGTKHASMGIWEKF